MSAPVHDPQLVGSIGGGPGRLKSQQQAELWITQHAVASEMLSSGAKFLIVKVRAVAHGHQ
ncbi:hypothetical protein [Streptomyces sp. CB09030]|uniref:hypothetical protein n=1 Tax=Streptomyces sp. CB09030 TaxID=2913412 RepID=UPI001FB82082|nr:hypothetical protein [Streptomyces sp. CB09030]UOG79470.1 hypothetical protein L6J92_09835 [Streptomyces sp. CB09030]